MKYTEEYIKGFANGFVDALVLCGKINDEDIDKVRKEVTENLLKENETKNIGEW